MPARSACIAQPRRSLPLPETSSSLPRRECEESVPASPRRRRVRAALRRLPPTTRFASFAQQRLPRSAARERRRPRQRAPAELRRLPCRQAGSRRGRGSEDRLVCERTSNARGPDARTGSHRMPATSAQSLSPSSAISPDGRPHPTIGPKSRRATRRRPAHTHTETRAPYRAPPQADASSPAPGPRSPSAATPRQRRPRASARASTAAHGDSWGSAAKNPYNTLSRTCSLRTSSSNRTPRERARSRR